MRDLFLDGAGIELGVNKLFNLRCSRIRTHLYICLKMTFLKAGFPSMISRKDTRQQESLDFPDGPMVKTTHFQCRGPRFNPCSGKFHMSHSATKKISKIKIKMHIPLKGAAKFGCQKSLSSQISASFSSLTNSQTSIKQFL